MKQTYSKNSRIPAYVYDHNITRGHLLVITFWPNWTTVDLSMLQLSIGKPFCVQGHCDSDL